jgi:hypothetical protein
MSWVAQSGSTITVNASVFSTPANRRFHVEVNPALGGQRDERVFTPELEFWKIGNPNLK